MTDIEFAKEVAEKVWGWEFKISDTGHKYWDTKEDRQRIEDEACSTVSDEFIDVVVNSWQGFGRTVEAMFKMGWGIEALPDEYYVGFCNAKGKCFAFLETPENDSARWIKATHQAALDAVKEKE